MEKELQNFKIARFALNSTFDDIGAENIDQLKNICLTRWAL